MFSFPDISDYSPNPKTLVPPTAVSHVSAPKIQPFAFKTTSAMAAEATAPVGGGAGDGSSCVSSECEACRLHVLEGFSHALNASSQFQKRVNSKREPPHGTECGYVQAKQKQKEMQQATLTKMSLQNDETVDQMVKLLMRASRKRRDVNNNGIDDGSDSFTSVDQSELKDKCMVTESPVGCLIACISVLGVSTKISCDYVRGETLSSGTPWCGLCNICWTWRKLPPEYFPAYLNEVSCDSDNACLAGFGKCRPVLRTLTVLKNTSKNSTEQWEQQSINTVAACECQVEAGTPLHSFIVR